MIFALVLQNKAPAPVQITAEQLLREAKERELELAPPPPKQNITSKEELDEQKMRRRKVFEGTSASYISSIQVEFC